MTSLIYMITPTTQDVTAGGVIPLSTISRRTGCAIQNNSDSVVLNKAGYYKVTATVTFNGSATGDVTVTMQNNGTNVAGFSSTETVGTANTEIHTITLTGYVRVYCNAGTAVLTLVNNSEVAIETLNVALSVEYV